MAYPIIAAGQRITASLLTSMMPQHILKASDTTRTSVATPTADPHLAVDLDANARYKVEAYLFYAAGAGGFRTQWTGPSGASALRSAWGPNGTQSVPADPTGPGRWGVHGLSTSADYVGRSTISNQVLALETLDVITTSAGTLSFVWGQTASNAAATIVTTRSHLRVWRVA